MGTSSIWLIKYTLSTLLTPVYGNTCISLRKISSFIYDWLVIHTSIFIT